ncbi:MAG TPA: hypothetical protein DCG37_01005 [Lachnospiraceae bacterium]|nr:hypothetical protein [Lachnospiraceae bacterium]
MINWLYFPKNRPLDSISEQVVNAFRDIASEVDSETQTYESDEVLEIVRPGLETIGFKVEKSKKKKDLVPVPVLYGVNGKIEKSFEADGYFPSFGYVVEVEAGRGFTNHQFLKDFFEACTMVGVEKLCIAVRNKYKTSNDFEKVCRFFEAMYASGRLGIPLSGLLIIGY